MEINYKLLNKRKSYFKVEPVAGVVVGGNGLRVAVDHYPLIAQSVEFVHAANATGVKLHGRSNPVDARTQDDHAFWLPQIF
jgi:hypothetical protein